MKNEIWQTVKGYEDFYLISSFGRLKSKYSNKILKQNIGTSGYLFANLYKDKNGKPRMIHQLVAESFLNHSPSGQHKVVDHKDGNRLNNNVDNLQITTQRHNTNKSRPVGKSGYRGVAWSTVNKKWQVRPRVGGVKINVGYFDCPKKAHQCYVDFSKYISNYNTAKYTREELRELIKQYKQKLKECIE